MKGVVAYCNIARKKVSMLKYPCRGNYKRCPIYIRRPISAVERREEKPKIEEVRQAKPVLREEKPTVIQQSKPVERAEIKPSIGRESVEVVEAKITWRPGDALCDSLLMAFMVTIAETIGVIRGDYNMVEEKLISIPTDGSFILAVGRVDNSRVRFTYSNKIIFSMMVEKDGVQECGKKALEYIKPVSDKIYDLVLYNISWNSLGGWANQLKKDLDNALKGD